MELVLDLLLCRSIQQAPEREPANQESPHRDGKPMNERCDVMWFEDETMRGGLDPELLAHPSKFAGHLDLVFVGPDMLDDAIGVDHLEFAVRVSESGGISRRGLETRLEILGDATGSEVEQDGTEPFGLRERPGRKRATHIEDRLAGNGLDHLEKPFQSPAPDPAKQPS